MTPVAHWVAETREVWAEVHWDIERLFEGHGVVLSFYRATGIGRQSGVEVVRDLAGVYRIRDGLIASERGLPRPRGSPRSRGAAEVGDVA